VHGTHRQGCALTLRLRRRMLTLMSKQGALSKRTARSASTTKKPRANKPRRFLVQVQVGLEPHVHLRYAVEAQRQGQSVSTFLRSVLSPTEALARPGSVEGTELALVGHRTVLALDLLNEKLAAGDDVSTQIAEIAHLKRLVTKFMLALMPSFDAQTTLANGDDLQVDDWAAVE
jgi:hypothetical protein